MTAVDLNLIPRVSDASVSPSGDTSFVFGTTVWDRAANKKTTNLYLSKYGEAGAGVRRLAPQDYVSDTNAVWTRDGKTILFLSNRGGGAMGLWGIKVNEPDVAYKVSEYPIGIDTFKVRGETIAMTAMVFPGKTMAETAAKEAELAGSRVGAQKYDVAGEFVNRWDAWWPTPVEYSHVHVGRLSYDAASGRWKAPGPSEVVDVMGAMSGDCPSRPFGDAGEYDIAPDEKAVAFTTQVGSDKRWSTDLNVYEYDLAAGATQARCLSCSNPATDTAPAYSPDGKYIAYLAMAVPKYESDTKHIRLYDRGSGRVVRDVARGWDRSVDGVQWHSKDAGVLYATALDTARQKLFRVDVAADSVAHFAGDSVSTGFSVVACADNPTNTCALFTKSDLRRPSEVYVTLSSGEVVQKTSMAAEALKEVEFTEVSEMWFEGAGGDSVHAWLHKPYGWSAGKKYPVVLYCHGGPESPWEDAWSYRWNPQLIAAQGYAVLAPNFHGSGSFGSNFTRAILGEWGGKPFTDLMTALDVAAQRFPWIDLTRGGHGGKLRRLHDQLDQQPDHALQVPCLPRRRLQPRRAFLLH